MKRRDLIKGAAAAAALAAAAPVKAMPRSVRRRAYLRRVGEDTVPIPEEAIQKAKDAYIISNVPCLPTVKDRQMRRVFLEGAFHGTVFCAKGRERVFSLMPIELLTPERAADIWAQFCARDLRWMNNSTWESETWGRFVWIDLKWTDTFTGQKHHVGQVYFCDDPDHPERHLYTTAPVVSLLE